MARVWDTEWKEKAGGLNIKYTGVPMSLVVITPPEQGCSPNSLEQRTAVFSQVGGGGLIAS